MLLDSKDNTNGEHLARVQDAFHKRELEDLFKVAKLYGFEKLHPHERNLALATTLAREKFPAPTKKGRSKKWSDIIRSILVVDVERQLSKKTGDQSDAWACRQLAKVEPWKSFVSSGDLDTRTEAIRKTYFSSRSLKWVAVFRGYCSSDEERWWSLAYDLVKNPDDSFFPSI